MSNNKVRVTVNGQFIKLLLQRHIDHGATIEEATKRVAKDLLSEIMSDPHAARASLMYHLGDGALHYGQPVSRRKESDE